MTLSELLDNVRKVYKDRDESELSWRLDQVRRNWFDAHPIIVKDEYKNKISVYIDGYKLI